ncbi:MAG: PEP-CTERM sorting domain-containing protein [Crocosphaera sp.]
MKQLFTLSRFNVTLLSSLSTASILWTNTVLAGTITQNGSELFNNPNVSFPTINPSLIDNTLRFGTGNVLGETMLRWDLFPANSLTSTSPTTTIQITANMQRLISEDPLTPQDWDPAIYLWDGTNIVGGIFGDNLGGSFRSVEGTSNGTFNNFISGPLVNAGTIFPIGSSGDINVDFELGETSTKVTLSWLGGSLPFMTNNFDRTQSLSLLIARNEVLEQYGINNINIESVSESPETIPESSNIVALFVFLGLGLFVIKRK